MRTKKGTITSAKMTGTVTVTVHRSVVHPLYRKAYRVSTKFLADTGEFKDLHEGDTVVMTECRPLSKRKRFIVTEVLARAAQVSELQEEAAVSVLDTGKRKASSASTESPASSASSKR